MHSFCQSQSRERCFRCILTGNHPFLSCNIWRKECLITVFFLKTQNKRVFSVGKGDTDDRVFTLMMWYYVICQEESGFWTGLIWILESSPELFRCALESCCSSMTFKGNRSSSDYCACLLSSLHSDCASAHTAGKNSNIAALPWAWFSKLSLSLFRWGTLNKYKLHSY